MENKLITIFAIMDDPQTLQQIAQVVDGEAGYVLVGQTTSGLEGIAYCKANMPDIVLLDLNIQDMRVLDVVTAVRDLSDTVGIILMSVSNPPDVLREALLCGVDDFLSKPIFKSEFLTTVGNVLKSKGNDNGESS